MHWAALHEAAAARLFFGSGAEKDAVGIQGYGPLHLVASQGQVQVAQLLLHSGAEKEAPAAMHGHLEAVRLSLYAGVEKALGLGRTPLQGAARNGHTEVVRLLLHVGAGPHRVTTEAQVDPELVELLHVPRQDSTSRPGQGDLERSP